MQGDVLALPFEDASFDSATVGFGVRNVEDLEAGIRELRRVLREGGRLGILEITTPRGRLAPFYRVWFDHVVPLLGKVLPGRRRVHVPAGERAPLPRAGRARASCSSATASRDVRYRTFAGGIVALHVGEAA